MRKIIVTEHVTLDGVMQAPGDPSGRGCYAAQARTQVVARFPGTREPPRPGGGHGSGGLWVLLVR
jgi:hypothetical protein